MRTLPSGAVLQSGIHYKTTDPTADSQFLLRGVVVATYVCDDPQHPYAASRPTAVYCDVIAYTSMRGGSRYALSNCLVRQDMGGMHRGIVYKPRAAKGMVTGGPMDVSNPQLLDGDHVLIGFIDRQRTMPVILGGLPHPYADQGALKPTAKLSLVDGDPMFLRHHGCTLGVSDAGNIEIDASSGNSGAIAAGVEAPHVPGSGGNINATLAPDGALSVATTLGPTLQLSGAGLTAGVGIGCAVGAGTQHLVVAEKLVLYLQTLVTWANSHTHIAAAPGAPTAVGLPPLAAAPDLSSPAISLL